MLGVLDTLEVERLVRKMLLKTSSTSLPITLNPMCQPLASERLWGICISFHRKCYMVSPPNRSLLGDGTWESHFRMVSINFVLMASLVLHMSNRPYVEASGQQMLLYVLIERDLVFKFLGEFE